MTINIAIVGAGPAGLYAADALLKVLPESQIDVFEKYPPPYGLIRYGVAPDHYKTRNTSRQFARTLEDNNVGYFGNVDIGSDITFAELKENYNAIILAVGAYNDRELGIPGEKLPGVYGACAFVGWYNGHPEFRDLNPKLDQPGVAVIGIGNVALDVCRVLAKTRNEHSNSDISEYALQSIEKAPLEELHMFGRRGPIEAGFTPKELGETRDLERCHALVDSGQLPETVEGEFEGREKGIKEKNLNILKELANRAVEKKPISMNFSFYSSPKEILGVDRVEGIRLEKTEVIDGRAVPTGEEFEVPCGTVVTAIGYHTAPISGVSLDGGIIKNSGGRVDRGIYVVGWAKRGPSGTIPTNGPDSRDVVDLIASELESTNKAGREAINALLEKRNIRRINFEDWQLISEQEFAQAITPRPRERFTRVEDMLAVLEKSA